jgi:osmoprotectant transport system permease protein
MIATVVIPNFGGGGAQSCVQENRLFCFGWLRSNWSPVLQPALVQHIVLTVIAVVLGFLIAMALAPSTPNRGWR